MQNELDLFTAQPVISSSVAPTLDLFSAPEPVLQPDSKIENSGPTNNNIFDPFAAVPLNKFDGSDLFGDFTSQSDSAPSQLSKDPFSVGSHDDVNGKSSSQLPKDPVTVGSHDDMNSKSLPESKIQPKKDFQVKSGVWADSLSRGLIDLNISARKSITSASFCSSSTA